MEGELNPNVERNQSCVDAGELRFDTGIHVLILVFMLFYTLMNSKKRVHTTLK